MDVKQLEYFRAIVDAGTISGAARVLHMTQPPLSYQIKMLEEELQVQLFLRGTKKITLTEAGKTLYDRAGSLLTMADITKREVIKASQAATIHIGFTPSTVSLMSDYLTRFPRHIRISALISMRDQPLPCGSNWKTAWWILQHSGHRSYSKAARAGHWCRKNCLQWRLPGILS